MEKSTGKIGIKEYVSIILLVVAVKNSDGTTAVLFESTFNSYWMIPLLIFALMVIPLYLLMKVITLYKDKNLHDCIVHLFGKYIGNVISFVLLLIGLFILVTDSAAYVDIIGTMYYSETPNIILTAVLLTASSFIAMKGIEALGTISWAVLFYLLTGLFLSLLLALQDGSLSFIFPLLGNGAWNVMKESTAHVSFFAEYLFIGLLAPAVTSARAYKKGTFIGLGIATIILSYSYLTYLFVFDTKGMEMVSYPYHELIRVVRLGFLTNLESFLFPFWIVVTFIRFSFHLYIMALLFGGIFRITNFKYTLPSLSAIVLMFGMAIENPSLTVFFMRDKLLVNASFIFLVLPCLMWLIAKIKGEFKHAQANQSK